ncbi:MAG TPA: site-specific integrase [Acidobacteriaceae bacterium]|nr:site-specific integrase [Acidobacteriaceae bacterium]
MIDSVYLMESVRERHRKAPLLLEREKYLTYLSDIGTDRKRLRSIATMLLHVVRLLQLDLPRPIGVDEVVAASRRWMEDPVAGRHRKSGVASPYTFQVTATNWLRFRGSLVAAPQPDLPYGNLVPNFLTAMRTERGLALETLRSYRSRILSFLHWLQPRCSDFYGVRILDIDEYAEAKRSGGWSRASLAAHARTLRTFFGYAEERRWCAVGIRDSIASPRVPRITENMSAPVWQDVRGVIAAIGDRKPADLRAKAMFLLFAIYGFRSAEVRSMALEDIDWRRGTITIRRAKEVKSSSFPYRARWAKPSPFTSKRHDRDVRVGTCSSRCIRPIGRFWDIRCLQLSSLASGGLGSQPGNSGPTCCAAPAPRSCCAAGIL